MAMRRDGTIVEDSRTVVGNVCLFSNEKAVALEVMSPVLIAEGQDVAFTIADDFMSILVARMPRLTQDSETDPLRRFMEQK